MSFKREGNSDYVSYILIELIVSSNSVYEQADCVTNEWKELYNTHVW